MAQDENEKIELKVNFELTRKQLIDGELYINLDDFTKELRTMVASLDLRVAYQLNTRHDIATAAELFKWGDMITLIAKGLEAYTDYGKFHEIVKDEDISE